MTILQNGFVIIGPHGRVLTDGFDTLANTCREAGIEEMQWAQQHLRRAIAGLDDAIATASTKPYDRQTCASDFSDELMAALRADQWLNGKGAPSWGGSERRA